MSTTPTRRRARKWSATVPAVAPGGRLTSVGLTLTGGRTAIVILGGGTSSLVMPSGARQLAAALRARRRLGVDVHSGPTSRTLSVAPTARPGVPDSGATLTLRSASQVSAHWPLTLGPGPARSFARFLDEAADQCQRRR
ncbi:hypothetical protein [Actinoalloteichus spitiensis]|uniref:hypothetical protein n=1 Tax=Actinoalloteichus spitiensis TaxID=252394 RepID=UPI000360AE57|nr:hypothetical protein [Actinoalloteichus spitiensis]